MNLIISLPDDVIDRLNRLSARLSRPRSEVVTFLVRAATEDDNGSEPAEPFPEPVLRDSHP